jgi:hypothetical protein
MEVKVTNNLEPTDCYALHISWEDVLLRSCDTLEKANQVIAQFEGNDNRKKVYILSHNTNSLLIDSDLF